MVFKILVVSDSVSDKNLIKNTLSDYCVFTASNSSEAWSNLKKHQGINLVNILNLVDGNIRLNKR
jgi:CheY-like chemotaxis protein